MIKNPAADRPATTTWHCLAPSLRAAAAPMPELPEIQRRKKREEKLSLKMMEPTCHGSVA